MSEAVLPCIHVAKGDLPERVLVCGDPARADKIGSMMENARCLARNREFNTWSGEYKGVPVAVSSHGVGAGGAAIAFESLCKAGVKVMIRVGTCGGMQPEVGTGDLVVSTACCREDGVTEKMILPSYPAVADGEVVSALCTAAKENGIAVHKGITLTQALFYPGLLESKVKFYAGAGVLAMENEMAALYVLASLYHVKAGGIIAVDAPAFELVGVDGYNQTAGTKSVGKAVEDEIRIALDAIVNVKPD